MLFVFIKIYTLIKSYITLIANPSTNEDNPPNSIFHRASKTTNLLVLFLYIILYPHSLHLIGSLDFISFSVWHSPQIYIIGCCFGGWTSFCVSIDNPWNHRLKYWVSQKAPHISNQASFFSGKPKKVPILNLYFFKPMGRANGRKTQRTAYSQLDTITLHLLFHYNLYNNPRSDYSYITDEETQPCRSQLAQSYSAITR